MQFAFRHIRLVLPMLLVWAGFHFLACTRDAAEPLPQGGASAEAVPVEFAVSVLGSQAKATKGSITDITEIADVPVFRGMRDVYLLPFASHAAVKQTDRALSYSMGLAGITNSQDDKAVDDETWHGGLVKNNNAHLYKDISLPKSTGSVLVYGRAVKAGSYAESSAESKKLNGSMIATGVSTEEKVRYPSGISFAPEAIYTSEADAVYKTQMAALLGYLNGIADVSVPTGSYYFGERYNRDYNPTLSWRSPKDYASFPALNNAFGDFSNKGNKMAGSSKSINALLTMLYREAYQLGNSSESIDYYYNNTTSYSSGSYNYVAKLAQAIYGAINNSAYVTVDNANNASTATVTLKTPYNALPSAYGVPDGSAAIIWKGSQFELVDNEDPANGMAQRGSFCYPASLWYFANSTIKTSSADDERDHYVAATADWSSILSQYSGNTVLSDTKSVAVVEPLRYAPALLEVKIKAESATLADNDGDASTNVTLGTTNFPLTGILVGEQRKQAYNFTPTGDEAVYSLYDTNVKSASAATIYLTTMESAVFKTLVFPTPDDADVTVALEFSNNSGSRFFGAEGQIIPAGGTFYLIGQLKISDKDTAAKTVDGKVLNAVFTHTYKTTVTLTVKDLKEAVNTIPDLKQPQLSIGVRATIDWKQVTPGNLPLY